jgi:hypothetical protein
MCAALVASSEVGDRLMALRGVESRSRNIYVEYDFQPFEKSTWTVSNVQVDKGIVVQIHRMTC